MKSIPLVSDNNFEELILESIKPALLIFCTEWSGICHIISNSMEDLASEFKGEVDFFRTDIECCNSLIETFKVNQYPTIVFFKDQKPIDLLFGSFSTVEFKERIFKTLLNR